MSEDNIDKEILLAEVEDRLEDLKFEYGDDETSEVKIYEKLRDEFKGEEYESALISLGVNSSNLGLQTIEPTKSNSLLNKDDKNIDTLVKILLDPQPHIHRTERRIKGYEEIKPGDWEQQRDFLIPSKEIILIIQFLEALFMPQNIISKINLTIKDFEDTMNRQLNYIRCRLEDYPDHIVKPGTIKFVIGILLNEVQVIRNAIESGRLGDIATDMISGSYHERNDKGNDSITKQDIIEAWNK